MYSLSVLLLLLVLLHHLHLKPQNLSYNLVVYVLMFIKALYLSPESAPVAKKPEVTPIIKTEQSATAVTKTPQYTTPVIVTLFYKTFCNLGMFDN